MARIARLYEIEASIRGQDVAHRVAVRRAESQALNHRDGLARFLEDGRIDVNGWPQARIDQLMPWHWTAAAAR